jgi:hypothetical protein
MDNECTYPHLCRLVNKSTKGPPTAFTGHDLKAIWMHGCLGLRAVSRHSHRADLSVRDAEQARRWLSIMVNVLRNDPQITDAKIRAINAHVQVLEIPH